jgi:ectoine hydroxylase-related dioxygenase (phytanoyl-CoA dioxygenase family)
MNPTTTASAWLKSTDIDLAALIALAQTPTDRSLLPSAHAIEQGVPIYDCAELRQSLSAGGKDERRALMAEWAQAWHSGPGIVVLVGAMVDLDAVDGVTARFQELIERERTSGSGGDHFAAAGANDRVWNALEKLCLLDPELFARYYGNDMIAMASEAWLGPNYQVTSQVNNVRPGGKAQVAHRDYHLGFMTPAQAEQFPAHVHRLSPLMTLQGAVAHVDMPLESGPTLYLPHSQKFTHGYLLAEHRGFQAWFDQHRVQLPLKKGDAVFFNPALLHAAGNNVSTDIQRMANLLQVSSAFGRAMESVDRLSMTLALYPALQKGLASGQLSASQARCALAACAEGYAFPTNLDHDPPLGGLAPASPQAVAWQALLDGLSLEQLREALTVMANRRLT